ncbi:MAG: hypothetical protein ACXVIV_07630, partial [Halobacteriota archaeon]
RKAVLPSFRALPLIPMTFVIVLPTSFQVIISTVLSPYHLDNAPRLTPLLCFRRWWAIQRI